MIIYVVVGQAGDGDNVEKPLSTKLCTGVLIFCSIILIVLFFPFSLFYMIKVGIGILTCSWLIEPLMGRLYLSTNELLYSDLAE